MNSKNNILLGLEDSGEKIYSDDNDYRHIMLIAPHGTGKGVCCVLPNLLTFEESAIIHDIKMENYQLTSGYRASIGHKIFVWNPLAEKDKTHRYNPLDFITQDHEKIIDDVQKIVHLLIRDDLDYSASAKILLTSIILYLCANNTKIKSFGEITRMLDGDLIQELSNGSDKLKNILHPIAYQKIKAFLKKNPKEQNSIIKVLNDCLAPWNNPLIDYATSASDFDIADFKKHKTTLYIGVSPSDIDRIQPIMQFFYQHVTNRLIATAEVLEYNKNIGVCLFIDEFYSVGRLETLVSCIPYFRGYKIKLFLITSDINKIEKIYGEIDTNSLMSDCHTIISFAANNYETANKISKMCVDKSSNTELMSWQQIINLPSDSLIILRNNEQLKVLKKLFYYKDEELKKRIIKPVML
jgi:type IV secretion system protein VirD4